MSLKRRLNEDCDVPEEVTKYRMIKSLYGGFWPERTPSISDLFPTTKSVRAPYRPTNTTELPWVTFEGRIKYYYEEEDISSACRRLLSWLKNLEKQEVPLAFDMEWPTFGAQRKTALIQICPDTKHCYLFQVYELDELPSYLIKLISHPKVVLHGLNIKKQVFSSRKIAFVVNFSSFQ